MSLMLLAQLVAPPLQQGPIRLPEQRPGQERPRQPRPPADQPALERSPEPDGPVPPEPSPPTEGEGTEAEPPSRPPEPVPLSALPAIEGLTVYSQERLRTVLARCSALADSAQKLNACASDLTAQLVADGYVNSRVFVEATPVPGRLVAVEGRLVELRVNGNDEWLNRRVARLMRSLQESVLHLPTLERNLQLLRRVPGVKEVRGNLSRLGSDPSQALLTLTLEGGAPAWQGDMSLRNDGSNGSGEARAVATLLKPGALTAGDTLLLFGELNGDDDGRLGTALGSLSYTLPIGDAFTFTGAFGANRRNLIELEPPANKFRTDQIQGLGQLEWVFSESLTERWSLFMGLSGSSSDTTLDGKKLPPSTPEIVRQPQSGYLRFGLSGSGQAERVGWAGSAYMLGGLSALVPSDQRQEWRSAGVNPSDAIAIGALVSAAWGVAPSWQLSGRLAGQWAFNPLLPSMQFSLGSDVGLRGLPGQLISGDSGWLAVSEASWTFWENQANALQLVPFVGAGGVRSDVDGFSFSDTVGATGVLVRWLSGNSWAFELGWVHQFATTNNKGPWSDWVLADGLYAKAQFRF
jgi:hemolysin activation/secretion protein